MYSAQQEFESHKETKPLTEKRWVAIQKPKTQRCLAESGRDRLSSICDRLLTEFDPAHHGFHGYRHNTFINLRNLGKKLSPGDTNKLGQQEGFCSSRKKIEKIFIVYTPLAISAPAIYPEKRIQNRPLT
ncbi:hypothetical protein PoB_005234500 [Plakobranchus ocellatus]|uniref:Uncharacterized protein n=1 Tax=Plakobranchus ocellatus TaxID=259542 RepID=A0AAV4BZK7_9GAST|nr:hypothetical protein PoB_005234500 [Plakobranchus ocellatus]